MRSGGRERPTVCCQVRRGAPCGSHAVRRGPAVAAPFDVAGACSRIESQEGRVHSPNAPASETRSRNCRGAGSSNHSSIWLTSKGLSSTDLWHGPCSPPNPGAFKLRRGVTDGSRILHHTAMTLPRCLQHHTHVIASLAAVPSSWRHTRVTMKAIL